MRNRAISVPKRCVSRRGGLGIWLGLGLMIGSMTFVYWDLPPLQPQGHHVSVLGGTLHKHARPTLGKLLLSLARHPSRVACGPPLAAPLVSTPIAPAVVFVAAAVALSVLPSAILDILLLPLVTPLVILRILVIVFVVIIPVVIIPVVTSSPSASVEPAEWLASPSERLPAR